MWLAVDGGKGAITAAGWRRRLVGVEGGVRAGWGVEAEEAGAGQGQEPADADAKGAGASLIG